MEEKLSNATKEIDKLKGIDKSKINAFGIKCNRCELLCQSKKELLDHNKQEHTPKLKCSSCDLTFNKRSDLETHMKSKHESTEKFECEQCNKKFVLRWRLKKHQKLHARQNNRKCHYFNNSKPCPFEELGCMFEHSYSKNCKFGGKCDRTLCSYRHINNIVSDDSISIEQQKEFLICEECDLECKTENELDKHIDDEHEGWKISRMFCDYFCRTEHGIHICWSNEDFKEFLGFDIWSTYTGDESDTVFKCLKCDMEDDDKENMKKHIEEQHKHEITSKCNFCTYEDKSWLGLKKHYKTYHYNNH